jgi:tetrahydromethanopterin S-methyltransferase subunit G
MTIEQQNNIIRTLKEVDGETVQYILRKIGMDYQMLRQLIMTMPLESIHTEMSERFELERILRKG